MSKKELIPANNYPTQVQHPSFPEGAFYSNALYAFLGLDPNNYSRWCNRYLLKNPAAYGEFEQISQFLIQEELKINSPRPPKIFAISLKLAKKISMESGLPEIKDQTQEYFLACEEKAKNGTNTKRIESVPNAIVLANEGKRFGHNTLSILQSENPWTACQAIRAVASNLKGENKERGLRLLRDQVKDFQEHPSRKMGISENVLFMELWKDLEHELAVFLAKSRGQSGTTRNRIPVRSSTRLKLLDLP